MRNLISIIPVTAVYFVLQFLVSAWVGPGSAHADWYRWTDDEGKLHITDDIGTIPDEKRFEMEVFKLTAPVDKARQGRPAPEARPSAAAPATGEKAPELYGDETLQWWKETFMKLGREIDELSAAIEAKTKFVEIIESGRRVGQIYAETDVRTYEAYKAELPGDNARLTELTAEREELRRKARIVGVPKLIREMDGAGDDTTEEDQ